MPTKEEWQELIDNTTSTWTTWHDVYGRLFTASNGNSIFLPAAGYYTGSSLYIAGSSSIYWSSSLFTNSADYAMSLFADSDHYGSVYYYDRNCGFSVRPVLSPR